MSDLESANVITPQTVRMARAGLGWLQVQLADRAGIHPRTLKMFENGRVHPQQRTVDGLLGVFEQEGVVLGPDGSVRIVQAAP